MRPLSAENIESELSYAYLHAVAAQAGVSCEVAGRHADNAGIDAKLTGWGPFPGGGYRTEVDVKVQLKATVRQSAVVGGCCSYSLQGIARYDDLRTEAVSTPASSSYYFCLLREANGFPTPTMRCPCIGAPIG